MSAQGHEATLVIFDETTAPEDDDNHFTCCFDERIALCGMDLTDVPWITDEQQIDCKTCIRLEDADADWAPSSDSEPCPHCPRNALGGAS